MGYQSELILNCAETFTQMSNSAEFPKSANLKLIQTQHIFLPQN